ncbi:GNAT family N-acetyltransferase [Trinickia terrae]|uniref:GNAT family N-acetyltransferase n=1 Tax=Trinickia terrae TaxID=2571161 RepID=A0A4U1HEA8_9BURK|nr:GNAT family protein [Trinickia terrae]TKC78223.1 GNAT family N-acetyltransferase [Trinickia terrae]
MILDTPAAEQPTLTGKTVELLPLQYGHAAALLDAAKDGELWNLKVTVVPAPDTIDAYLERALAGRRDGTVMPFAIARRDTGKIVGTTRFWKIDRDNRKLEIGSTWLAASAQRTGINTEAKYLLLACAFETMQCVRVQFTTDELNAKSRAAILGIGAKQEGIVRNERIMPDGRRRNSVRFSIIDTEWPEVKAMLEKKLPPRSLRSPPPEGAVSTLGGGPARADKKMAR